MNAYLDAIHILIDKLSISKDVDYELHLFNPLSDEKIVEIESKNAVKVPRKLRALYKKSNGFQIAWTAKTSPYYKEVESYFDKVAWEWGTVEELHRIDFKLDLLPLAQAVERGNDYFDKKIKVLERISVSYGLELIEGQRSELKYHIWKHLFPEVDFRGGDASRVNTSLMRQLALQSKRMTKDELEEMIGAHHLFLETGGAGGDWQTLSTDNGLVMGVYLNAVGKEGQQINLARRNLTLFPFLERLDLPYADMCACFGEGLDFSGSNLSHSLLTDVFLANANFENANLSYCDFSRGDLKGAYFRNANLSHCDFENAKLDGADFRGAKWIGASFKGASMDGVKY